MPSEISCAVIGGGISGLSAAWRLISRHPEIKVTIFEADRSAGGWVQSYHTDGCILERGPDSFVSLKPQVTELAAELGMEGEIISPELTAFTFLQNGRFIAPPNGLRGLVPADIDVFSSSDFFSAEGKARILSESKIPPRADLADESFTDFVTRRFGHEMLERYAGPLFTGVYSTPASQLSMQACFPQWLKMEKEFGSLMAASAGQAGSSASRSPFQAFRLGMGQLTDKIQEELKGRGAKIQLSSSVTKVRRTGQYFELTSERGIETFDCVISAIHPNRNAEIFGFENETFATASRTIITCAIGGKLPEWANGKSGFIRIGEGNLRSATILSNKWPDRAPRGTHLVRVFLDTLPGDPLSPLKELGIDGHDVLQTWSFHYAGLPRYAMGHSQKVEIYRNRLREKFGYKVESCGAALDGVGIADCIASGWGAADRLAGHFLNYGLGD